ncbi:hypothetical protein TNIN_390971 [Trichonephila inaurata madagascariensis]|uniref:Uncharacterized protein n=1 Tax=Trichonephila inaurata madagascariensis TaxID=2747483 RepID=A0A8X6XU99_9ARAC|nr:hypothetical protein TNIN_390971 [Trichonephila inaurata madagascariensis]
MEDSGHHLPGQSGSTPDSKVASSRSRVRGMEDPVITFPDRVYTPDNKVANNRSRVRGMEDSVITFPTKIDILDSKIARSLMEVQRVGGPNHLKPTLEMSRKGALAGCIVSLFLLKDRVQMNFCKNRVLFC